VRELNPPGRTVRILSRRALEELSALQATVHARGPPRNAALRTFVASRQSTTPIAQHQFWLEFSWLDQEYRAAVRRLAQFCHLHKDGSPRSLGLVMFRRTDLETPLPGAGSFSGSQEAGQALASLEERSAG
jgi:hypothetical protein